MPICEQQMGSPRMRTGKLPFPLTRACAGCHGWIDSRFGTRRRIFPPAGTDQENSTSFDQMAGAIWRSVTLGFFLLFLWKQLSKFVFFLFFLRFLPRFWDRSGKRSQSLQIMGAIWRDWYGCVLPRVSLEIIFQKSLL